MSSEHNSVSKNLFLSACFCWDSRLYVRWTKNLSLVEPLVMVTHTWSFYFVTSNYLDYMQYYMMLQEQCEHIVAKVQATGTWLDEDRIHVCLVAWLDYPFALRRQTFCLPFSTLSSFEAVCLELYQMLSLQIWTLTVNWYFLLMPKFRATHFLQKSTNPPSKHFGVQETCTAFCGTVDVWIALSFPTLFPEM